MKRVMVFGAFDGLHPGHLDFFRQAKKYGDYLIVSVARDVNVKKIKGKLPLFAQEERFELVRQCRIVDRAVMGAADDFFVHIKAEKPDVICLGYDQWAKEEDVLADLRRVGLLKTAVVRLAPYKPGSAKSTRMKNRSVGI
ncbi:FAD synthase [Candidatus Curtissbacteria bacterium]|nr:FAD synthase [Candidatus Curtissbacteria bacterium]